MPGWTRASWAHSFAAKTRGNDSGPSRTATGRLLHAKRFSSGSERSDAWTAKHGTKMQATNMTRPSAARLKSTARVEVVSRTIFPHQSQPQLPALLRHSLHQDTPSHL